MLRLFRIYGRDTSKDFWEEIFGLSVATFRMLLKVWKEHKNDGDRAYLPEL